MVNKYRVAYLVSHPIQYQAPLLRLLNNQPDIELTVFFQSNISTKKYRDVGFGRSIEWDVPLLNGYRHEFLPALGRRDIVTGFWPINYGITKRLWQNEFDFLWVHGYARWFNWISILAARILSIPVLIRDDATLTSAQRSPIKTWLKRAIFFRVFNALCDGVLAVGTANRKYYLENGIEPDRIFLVPNCTDNDYFIEGARTAAERREPFRRELSLTPTRPIILFVAKLQRLKRAEDLILAFKKLVESSPSLERPYLLFVGDGEMRKELEILAEPYDGDIRFLGFRNQSELPAFFDLCDVFVLCSEFETWGFVINEAMCAGRPVVVSDRVGAWPDLVENGINGYVYPVGDTSALAEALRRVLYDSGLAKSMGHASRDIIDQWNYQRDVEGLRCAMATIAARRKIKTN